MARGLQLHISYAQDRNPKFRKWRFKTMANAPVKAIKKGKKLGAVKPLMTQRPLVAIRPLLRAN
jgi:hypothetical protein